MEKRPGAKDEAARKRTRTGKALERLLRWLGRVAAADQMFDHGLASNLTHGRESLSLFGRPLTCKPPASEKNWPTSRRFLGKQPAAGTPKQAKWFTDGGLCLS